ncbi:ABC transporter permease subunit [Thermotoga sp. KOL6]|uniref:ABC transporter permease subunit n=1 Tax=Thermotoga sp. KOL6 TaxID=126741 RepID=UPI000C77A3CB|nr:ABC transporter permease subunit [Thermotoga sp. KOL6]PLV59462.1 ABC transporter permease [Thermotoga sp. KOL6]
MFAKEFRDMRVRFLALFFVLLGTFMLLLIMKDYTQNLSDLIKTIPNDFLKKLGVTNEFIQRLSEWNFYILSQWYGKNLGQFIPILAIIMAFPVFAREIENETIELLLTRIQRRTLFGIKFLIPFLASILELAVLALLPIPVSWIIGEHLDSCSVFQYFLVEMVGLTLWFSVTIFFSMIFSDQIKPLIVSIAILSGTTVIGGFIKSLYFLNTYSYILEGSLNIRLTAGYILASVTFIFLSYKTFMKRDF